MKCVAVTHCQHCGWQTRHTKTPTKPFRCRACLRTIVPYPNQTMPDQRSVTAQLRDLVQYANRSGMYDAADWINGRLATMP